MAACLVVGWARAVEPADEEMVRFVAYNLHNYSLHPTADRKASPAKAEREIIALVKVLTELRPDVLGVCEMGGEEDLQDFQRRLQTAGLPLEHREWVQGPDPTRHLALLSKFPIVARQSQTDLSFVLDQSPVFMQRGLLDVTLQVREGYQLRLVGLHLKSRVEVEDADQLLMRREEAHLVRLHVDEILTAQPQTNLLVYGDFNETKNQPGLREIKGPAGLPTALRDLALADLAGEKWTYHYEPADEYSRIDFVFASPGLLPELRLKRSGIYPGGDWKEASDHRPLFLSLIPIEQASR